MATASPAATLRTTNVVSPALLPHTRRPVPQTPSEPETSAQGAMRSYAPEVDLEDHAGSIRVASSTPVIWKDSKWQLFAQQKRDLIVSAVNKYVKSNDFDFEAHIEAVCGLSSQAFAHIPLPKLLHALWDDLAQPHILRGRCVAAADFYIVALCRRVCEQAVERRDLMKELRELECAQMSEVVEAERGQPKLAMGKVRAKLEKLDAEPGLARALEVFRTITSEGFLRYNHRVDLMLIKAAAFQGEMSAVFAVLKGMREKDRPLDSLFYYRIGLACRKARDVAAAEANYNSFVAAFDRGDLPVETVYDFAAPDEDDPFGSGVQENHSGQKNELRRQAVQEMLLETLYLAGQVERGDALWEDMRASGRLSGAQVAGYLRGQRAVLKSEDWVKKFDECIFNRQLSNARDDRRFFQLIFEALLEEEQRDLVALSHVYFAHLDARDLPISWQLRHLDTILDEYTYAVVTTRNNATRQQMLSRVTRLWMKSGKVCMKLDHEDRGELAPAFGATRRLVVVLAKMGRQPVANMIARTHTVLTTFSLRTVLPSDRVEHLHKLNRLLLYSLGEDVPDKVDDRVDLECLDGTVKALLGLQNVARQRVDATYAVSITPKIAELIRARGASTTDVNLKKAYKKLLAMAVVRQDTTRPFRHRTAGLPSEGQAKAG